MTTLMMPRNDFLATKDFAYTLMEYMEPWELIAYSDVNSDWKEVIENRIQELEKEGKIIVYDGGDIKRNMISVKEREKVIGIVFRPGTTRIGKFAFASTSITKVDVPETVTEIDQSAFSNCKSLTTLQGLPRTLTSIGERAFSKCTSLTSLQGLPRTLTSIGEYAFWNCTSLTSLQGLPDTLTSIGEGAFYYCTSLATLQRLPDTLASIGAWAFRGCTSITSIELPPGLKTIGASAFCGIHEEGKKCLRKIAESRPDLREQIERSME